MSDLRKRVGTFLDTDPAETPVLPTAHVQELVRELAAQPAEEELWRLSEELEQRIGERTAELAESEAKYRQLVEDTLDIPCAADGNGILRYVGPQAKRYGLDPAELEGRLFLDLVFADDRERVAADFMLTFEGGDGVPQEFRVQAPDGRVHWFEERTAVERDQSGTVTGFRGVLRDVTARKKAEQLQARQGEQLRHLAAKLASAQDDEQRRIAEGLHDDVAQILMACSIKMVVAERARSAEEAGAVHAEVTDLLRVANEKVRSLSFELSSSTLYRLGLRDAVRELCQTMSTRYGIRFEMQADDTPEFRTRAAPKRAGKDGTPAGRTSGDSPGRRRAETRNRFGDEGQSMDLDEATAIVLFKAARELLFNVVRHANVRRATVSLRCNGETLELAVEDRGKGFPHLSEGGDVDAGLGLGLFGIRERLSAVDGHMRIESTPDVATRDCRCRPVRSTACLGVIRPKSTAYNTISQSWS